MIQCTFENGRQASLRHVTVCAIAINERAEVLLVKRAAHLTRGGKFTVPGGFLDRDEDTQVGALRELEEETGYFGKITMLFQINENAGRPKEDRQNVDFVYIVDVIGGSPKDNSEVEEIKWFPFDQLPSEDDFAFDHRKTIEHYFIYRINPFPLPIIGKI